MPDNILTGSHIALRALEPGDVDLLYSWENDTSVWPVSNTLAPFSRFQIEEYVLNAQNDIYATKQLRMMIDVQDAVSGEKSVGTVDLFDYDPHHFRAGLGILIRGANRHKGYGYEAMTLFIHYAFGTLRLHQLYCNISPENLPSLNLFKKLGFVKCGTKKDWIFDGKKWQEEWMFQLISHGE